jgi:hypothetical protein
MKIFKSRWHAALPISLSIVLSSAYAQEELPPPPAGEEMPSIEADASIGADLPPPPDSAVPEEVLNPPPEMTAEAPEAMSNDDLLPETPPEEVASDLPADPMTPTAPPEYMQSPQPSRLSTRAELSDLSMEEKLKSKELVLWLSLGPSYGALKTKGAYTVATTETVGGLGYSAGLGGMVTDAFLIQADFMGTPRTDNSTVDHIMFGFGPRLGFITLMAMVGVQQGVILSNTTAESPPLGRQMAIGAKAGLDLVLSHGKESRMSIGLAPEAFYMTTQGKNGYTNSGIAVSLRLYGYENAF